VPHRRAAADALLPLLLPLLLTRTATTGAA
jgi:hypothetical protein